MGNDKNRPPPRMENIQASRYGFPDRPVTDVTVVRSALAIAMERGFNVMAPPIELTYIPEDYQVAVRIVGFPTDGAWKNSSNGTWYKTEGGGLALHKPALNQLLAAAGASVFTERIDDGRDPCRWEYRASVRVRTMDAVWRTIQSSKELDLRDSAPAILEMVRAARAADPPRNPAVQISKERATGQRKCESKAINAAIRAAFGLKLNYTEAEAALPFLFPILLYTPSSPDAKRMQAAVELGVVAQVYGHQAPGKMFEAPAIEVPADEDDAEPPDLAREPAPESRQIAPATDDWEAQLQRRERPDPIPASSSPASTSSSSTARMSPHPDDAVCAVCHRPITPAVLKYSTKVFNEPRCLDHQRDGGK